MINKQEDYTYSSYNEYVKNKDLITENSIQLAFGSIENYNYMFEEIHKIHNIEDIIDIKEEIRDSKTILEGYTKEKNKTIEEIVKDENEFYELLLILRHDGNLSLREMSKIFNINKDKINRIIYKRL